VVIGTVTLCVLVWPVVKLIYDFFDFDLGGCGVTYTRHLPSPNGKYDLIIQELDCGATVSRIYEYSIVKAGQTPDRSDLFLRIDHGLPGQEAFKWVTANHLKAYIPAGQIWEEKTLVRVDSGASIRINFQFSPSCEHIKQKP